MPRRHFQALEGPGEVFERFIPKPTAVPDGYTPVILVIEWLTLNCADDWACRASAKGLRVRFRSARDHDRAVARFLSPDIVVSLAGPTPARARRPRRAAA